VRKAQKVAKSFIVVRKAQLEVLRMLFTRAENKLVTQMVNKDIAEMRFKVSEELNRLLKLSTDAKKSEKKDTKKVKKVVVDARKFLKSTQDIALQS
jgi:hypothetical protein